MQKSAEFIGPLDKGVGFFQDRFSCKVFEEDSIESISPLFVEEGVRAKKQPMGRVKVAQNAVCFFIEEFFFQEDPVIDIPDQSLGRMIGCSDLFSLPGGLLLLKELAEVEEVRVINNSEEFAFSVLFYGKAFAVGIGQNAVTVSVSYSDRFSFTPVVVCKERHDLIMEDRKIFWHGNRLKGGNKSKEVCHDQSTTFKENCRSRVDK